MGEKKINQIIMTTSTKCLHMFIGTSKSGKSYTLRYLLSEMLLKRKLKFGIVFTSTKHNDGYNWLPDDYVFGSFSRDRLNAYITWLKKIKKLKGSIPENFIVLDDIVNSLPQSEKWWNEFLSTYRHYNITLYVTTQHISRCQPLFREQASFAYIFQLHTKHSIKACYESYGQLFETVGEFKAFIRQHAGKEYQCVVWAKEAKPQTVLKYKTLKAPVGKKEITFEF